MLVTVEYRCSLHLFESFVSLYFLAGKRGSRDNGVEKDKYFLYYLREKLSANQFIHARYSVVVLFSVKGQ